MSSDSLVYDTLGLDKSSQELLDYMHNIYQSSNSHNVNNINNINNTTTFTTLIKKTTSYIFDNNEYKLFINLIEENTQSNLYEYKLTIKSTGELIKNGYISINEIIELSLYFNICYIDGYFFDLIDDCFT
jgi:hypothetical protein